jgi:hypothetical protein
MSWEETRGSARVAVGAARQVAHADDAKSRVDEATRLPTKSLRPRVLTAVGAGAAVLGLVAFLAFRGGDAAEADRAAPGDERPSPSSAPSEPTPAEVLAQSQPSGEWNLVIFDRTVVLRDGTTTRSKARSERATWTFPAVACSDTLCSGTITSSSGREFPFTWNGGRLKVTRPDKVERDVKRPCVDTVTGEEEPIAESAFRTTNHYTLKPFTGTASRMTAQATTRVTFEVFGTCKVSPQDAVLGTYEWIMTRER